MIFFCSAVFEGLRGKITIYIFMQRIIYIYNQTDLMLMLLSDRMSV